MQVGLISAYNKGYEEMAAVSEPLMKGYCRKHDIIPMISEINSKEDIYWEKLRLVKRALSCSEWVIWSDIDVLFLNHEFDLREYIMHQQDNHLIISSDHRGLCLGFFAVKSSRWSLAMLESMLFLGNIKEEKVGLYDNKNQREQDTLKVLLDFFQVVQDRVSLIPESIISNPRSQQLIGRFAHHYWANRNFEQVLNEMVKDAQELV